MSTQQATSANASLAWQSVSGEKWVRLQASTDAQLAPLGLLALDALHLTQGERVLDVGCGAGQTLLQIAERVGVNGRVVGLDISPPLLARAQALIAEYGVSHAEVVLGDAAAQPFAGEFDALFSRFGLMFFDEPGIAFQNLAKALKPRGRLSFVCWQAMELNPWTTVPLAAVQRVAPDQAIPEMLTNDKPGPFRFADPKFVHSLLANAGFVEIDIQSHETLGRVGGAKDVAEAVAYLLEIGPAARFVSSCDAGLMPQFRAALSEAVTPFQGPDGVVFAARTFVCTARRG